MLKYLKMTNVGPAPTMELDYGKRLNLLTGDNGLGKSFLLDAAWFALTGKWPAQVNSKLTAGQKAVPSFDGEAIIEFGLAKEKRYHKFIRSFENKSQSWAAFTSEQPSEARLVIYAMADGSFAIWDSARNRYWKEPDRDNRLSAYVFSPGEVWDGLPGEQGKWLCNGLIRDWAGWQKENGLPFKNLTSCLEALSPSETVEEISPGELKRVSLDDARDIPSLRMSYHQDVPIIFASAGMRRIMALAYFLVWTWEEHKKAAGLTKELPTNQIVFLIDEIESHLHPSWQRRIIPAVLKVMERLNDSAEVQLIAATHSPLVMASVEPLFDPKLDAWFDLDLKDSQVLLTRRDFVKRGDACNWLTSEAFDMASSRNIEDEHLIDEASKLLDNHPTADEVKQMEMKLSQALPPTDSFLFRWRAICAKKGLLNDSRTSAT